MKPVTVYLGIGSNINREEGIAKALTKLGEKFGDIQVSPTFESKSVGFDGDNFYNLVVSFQTQKSLEEVVAIYKAIEDESGRNRNDPKFSSRTLDIDPLLYGDLICSEPVKIPRDEILENAYVLWPLALLSPNELHPETGKSYLKHWQSYENTQKLWQVSVPWDKEALG